MHIPFLSKVYQTSELMNKKLLCLLTVYSRECFLKSKRKYSDKVIKWRVGFGKLSTLLRLMDGWETPMGVCERDSAG